MVGKTEMILIYISHISTLAFKIAKATDSGDLRKLMETILAMVE